MSKLALASIETLTFYQDALTTARRTDSIPQLNCIGRPCNLYTPEVVRCTNVGGKETDIDWKCEADLPEMLRFGRVEVSCEGWSGPEDPYILKGSCALNYRLVQVPDTLRQNVEKHGLPSRLSRWVNGQDLGSIIFVILWWAIVLFIVYKVVKSCYGNRRYPTRSNPLTGAGPGSGWSPGTHHDDGTSDVSPPPYSKYSSPSSGFQAPVDWRPGFWTGAAAGGLGTYMFTRNQRQEAAGGRVYDWERPRSQRSSFSSHPLQQQSFRPNDRGEGSSSSSLGPMRHSTGLGGSSVR